MGLLGSNIFISQGYEHRNEKAYKAQAYQPNHYKYCFDKVKDLSIEYCVFHSDGSYDREANVNNVSAIILGDSHASSVALAILESMKNVGDKGDLIFYGHPGCLPLADDINEIVQTDYANSCNYRNRHILDIIKNNANEKTKIILSNRFPMYIYGMNELGYDKPYQHLHYMKENHDIEINKNNIFKSYSKLIRSIYDLDKNIYIVAPIPEQKINIPKVNGKSAMLDIPEYKGVLYSDYINRNKDIFTFINEIKGVNILNPDKILCDSDLCKSSINGKSLYYDDDHLSPYGAHYISHLFDPIWN